MADDYRGDKKAISILQIVRILVVATIIPLWARFGGEITHVPNSSETSWSATTLLIFTLGFAAGYAVSTRLKLSQLCLLIPMVVVGIFYATDILNSPPREILYAAQIVFGASIGARFDLRDIRSSAKLGQFGALLACVHILLAVAAAKLVSTFSGYSFWVALLAFAPGGVAEICLTAVLLNLQPELVALVQTFRLILIAVLVPVIARFIDRRSS